MVNLTKENLYEFINSEKIDSAIDSKYFYFKIPANWGNVFIKSKIENPLGAGEFDVPEYKVYYKIPVSILLQLRDLFKDIYAKYKTEVFAFILENRETGKYIITVPEQTVTSSSVKYKPYIDNGYKLIANVHSHHDMGAFFSVTDDNDDRNDTSLSIVLADLDSFLPEMKIRTWAYNQFISISPLDVFYFEPYINNDNVLEKAINKFGDKLYDQLFKELVYQDLNQGAFKVIVDRCAQDIKESLFDNNTVSYDYRTLIDQEAISKIKYSKVKFDEKKIKEEKVNLSRTKYYGYLTKNKEKPKYNGEYEKAHWLEDYTYLL